LTEPRAAYRDARRRSKRASHLLTCKAERTRRVSSSRARASCVVDCRGTPAACREKGEGRSTGSRASAVDRQISVRRFEKRSVSARRGGATPLPRARTHTDERGFTRVSLIMAVGESAPYGDGPFAECHELIEEMRRIYATDEDTMKARQLNEQFAEVRELCERREVHMQDVIKEMVQKVKEAEKAATPTESEEEHKKRLAQAESEKRAAEEYLTHMEHEAMALENSQAELKAEAAKLKMKKQELTDMEDEGVPRLKHELSLYAHISKISWAYDRPDRIKGRVNGAGEVKPFDFAPDEMTEFELVNKMWDLID
jgi:kinetochore protein Spc24, animal type